MAKSIIYTRFSPRRNADESESIETQLEYCRSYCARKKYEIAAEYEDRALSGSDEDRPGLWHAVEALKRGYVLVVYRLDRLARDVYLSELLQREAQKKGARIEAVEGGANGHTPEQQMIRQVLQAFGEYERKVTAARTRAAMLKYQKDGRRMSAKPPYGLMVDPDSPRHGKSGKPTELIECPEEQTVIGRIRELWSDGNSLREIARVLTDEGITSRKGTPLRHQQVARILREERQ